MLKGSASITSTSGSGVAVGEVVVAGCAGAVVAVGSGTGVDVGSGSSVQATADVKITAKSAAKTQIRPVAPKRIVRTMLFIAIFSSTQR